MPEKMLTIKPANEMTYNTNANLHEMAKYKQYKLHFI